MRPKKSRRSTTDISTLPALTENLDHSTRNASFSPARKGTVAACCSAEERAAGARVGFCAPREESLKDSVPPPTSKHENTITPKGERERIHFMDVDSMGISWRCPRISALPIGASTD